MKTHTTNFNEELLIVPTAEFSYLLGFLWGDGHFKNSGATKSITLEIVKSDLDEIRPCIESTGVWAFRKPRSRHRRKESQTAYNGDKNLSKFLEEMGFATKSIGSPRKIIEFLGDELLPQFLLGFSDADGCLRFAKQSSGYSKSLIVQFSGPQCQEWKWLECICNRLNILYHINRRVRSTGNSSEFVVNGRYAKILCDYMYSADLRCALDRKKQKYLDYGKYLNRGKVNYNFNNPECAAGKNWINDNNNTLSLINCSPDGLWINDISEQLGFSINKTRRILKNLHDNHLVNRLPPNHQGSVRVIYYPLNSKQ